MKLSIAAKSDIIRKFCWRTEEYEEPCGKSESKWNTHPSPSHRASDSISIGEFCHHLQYSRSHRLLHLFGTHYTYDSREVLPKCKIAISFIFVIICRQQLTGHNILKFSDLQQTGRLDCLRWLIRICANLVVERCRSPDKVWDAIIHRQRSPYWLECRI